MPSDWVVTVLTTAPEPSFSVSVTPPTPFVVPAFNTLPAAVKFCADERFVSDPRSE